MNSGTFTVLAKATPRSRKPLASPLVRGAAMASRILVLLLAFPVQAQSCRVLDPELQGSYAGPCVNGLAEGYGSATGTAEYQGTFKAGRKHGKGEKTWPSGDRYEGEFFEDYRHGAGVYGFGRGPWQGERYEGAFAYDRRHGFGVYLWRTGDRYAGPWENDVATGPPTPMMQARAKFEAEALAAVAKVGTRVCRERRIGIAGREWIGGVVRAVDGARVAVARQDGRLEWTDAFAWTPCW